MNCTTRWGHNYAPSEYVGNGSKHIGTFNAKSHINQSFEYNRLTQL